MLSSPAMIRFANHCRSLIIEGGFGRNRFVPSVTARNSLFLHSSGNESRLRDFSLRREKQIIFSDIEFKFMNRRRKNKKANGFMENFSVSR